MPRRRVIPSSQSHCSKATGKKELHLANTVHLTEPAWQNGVPRGRSEVVPDGSQGLAIPEGPHGQVPNPALPGQPSPLFVPLRTPLLAVRCVPTWQHAVSFGARESSRRGVRDGVGFDNDRRAERVLRRSTR